MYRRADDGVLQFREAWYDEEYGQFVVNHGTVGHQSTTQETDVASAAAAERLMDGLRGAMHRGRLPEIPEEEQYWVVAQFALKSREGTEPRPLPGGKGQGRARRHFAWRGMGVVDRSESVTASSTSTALPRTRPRP